MFKKTTALLLIVMLAGVALMSCGGEQNVLTDDDLCQIVFGAIQSNNVDTFSSLLITEETIKEMATSLDDTDPKEKSIKAELTTEFDVEKVTGESLASFQKIIEDAKRDKIDLTKASYVGIISVRTRYEAGNHQCKAIKFKFALEDDIYSIRVDVFQTDQSMFIYDSLNGNKLVNYKFVLTSPTENPVTVAAGNTLDLAIAFDEDAANNEGAWIQTVFDGKGGGMYYASSMKSPYTTDIPGKVLTQGNHTIEFFLQPSGSNTDNPLASIKLDIVVK